MQIQVRVEEHLIIRSWFVVLLLCGENIFYINLMHAQNMSRSKPKKSLVTIQRGHFMNSVFVNPGIYSCAVDDFFSRIYQICQEEMSLQTCFSMLSQITSVQETEYNHDFSNEKK